MYHWEADQEDLLEHMIVGAGERPCVVVAIGGREHAAADCGGGAYTVDEAALPHGAGVGEKTSDGNVAYARFPEPEPVQYRAGWLPSG